MIKFYSISVLLILIFNSNLQAINLAPVAINDTITVNSGGTYIFSPWANDYDPDGDPFLIMSAGFLHNKGTVKVSYSSIEISMYYSSGVDTITYLLKDNHNNISNVGYIFVNINHNHTSDTLNINNISIPFVPFGNAFWDFSSTSNFEVPKGSGKTTIFTSVPWIGGLDQANHLHLAGESYRSNGTDYYYGPVCDTNTLYQYSDSLWNRVWKVSKAEIDYHKNNYWKSNYAVPEAITNWPAKGDANLGQSAIMAPYIDKNNDGKYVPSDGDYPKIKGDQSVFLIFNDSRGAHTESGGTALGIEVHEMAYAYDCLNDTALNNTIFIHYDIYNRSANNYHDVYLGLFTDFDIGYGYDDYIGCDSSRNLAYAYNAKAVDGFIGNPYHYGANPPAQGIVFLSEPMSSFMASNNTGIPGQSDPNTDMAMYHFMQAIWSNGAHLTYGGDGFQGTVPANFIYSGDPNDTTTWSERYPINSPSNIPFDRRGVPSIGPFNLGTGAVKSIDIAYVYARDTSKSNFQNISVLKYEVDKIQLYYDNDSTPCGGSFTAVSKPKAEPNSLKVYPVPTHNMLFIEYLPYSQSAYYQVYSVSGQLLQSGKMSQQNTHRLNLNNYKQGLYFILIRDGSNTRTKKFIVQ